MNLPNADGVEVEKEKITGYLLNPLHPDAAGKAAFFTAMGFTDDEWEGLANALRQVAACCPVVREVDSPHGAKYVVDGAMPTPIGRTPSVRTIWIINQGEDTPRLVTAYPHERGAQDAEGT